MFAFFKGGNKTQAGKTATSRRIQLSEKLASLGIMGDQLKAPPETPQTRQHHGIEGFQCKFSQPRTKAGDEAEEQVF